jgi:hypothetical protein
MAIRPSSISTRSPAFTSWAKPGYEMLARAAVPCTVSVVRTNGSPRRSTALPPPAKVPSRIFGPCRSWRIAIGLPILASTDRTRSIACRCSAWVPWEKLRRATSIPARAICSMMPSARDEGPMVQTIFARRSWAIVRSRSGPRDRGAPAPAGPGSPARSDRARQKAPLSRL